LLSTQALALKGLISRDFQTWFFIKHLPVGHWFTPENSLANHRKFAEIFAAKFAENTA
jgi:hypothetical protein